MNLDELLRRSKRDEILGSSPESVKPETPSHFNALLTSPAPRPSALGGRASPGGGPAGGR